MRAASESIPEEFANRRTGDGIQSKTIHMPTQTALEITLNGESRTIAAEATIAELLRGMDLDPSTPKGIAVAVNDEVVPKSAWDGRELEASDRVEVISARQGG